MVWRYAILHFPKISPLHGKGLCGGQKGQSLNQLSLRKGALGAPMSFQNTKILLMKNFIGGLTFLRTPALKRRVFLYFFLEFRVAPLAGHQDFAAAARGAQMLTAFGAAKIFINRTITKFLGLILKPAAAGAGEEMLHGEPDFLENPQLTLARRDIARKHAEDEVNLRDIGEQPDPEHAGNLRGKGNEKA